MSSPQRHPGATVKGKQNIEYYLKAVQLVVEVLEARAPASTRNSELAKMLGNKKTIIVLNKADLADRRATASWQKFFSQHGYTVFPCNSKSNSGVRNLFKFLQKSRKHIKPVSVPAFMIVGIPNVGKSTLVNQLLGKKSAATGARPGITKGPQWIKVPYGWYILDTPGLLPHKIKDKDSVYCLSVLGSYQEELLEAEELVCWLMQRLKDLGVQYDLWQILFDLPRKPQTGEDVVNLVGQRRGFIGRGGQVDFSKTSRLILKYFREGKLGSFSLELPEPINNLPPKG